MSNGYGRSTEGFGITRQQSVELIVKTALENGVTDPKQIAYILGTAQHETRNFNAPEEDFGRSQARKYGYGGGEEFFGRGCVHLTHKGGGVVAIADMRRRVFPSRAAGRIRARRQCGDRGRSHQAGAGRRSVSVPAAGLDPARH